MKTTIVTVSRRYRNATALFCAAAACLAFARCDFPDDPPLLKPDELTFKSRIDSARTLLPLSTGNIWKYEVLSRIDGRQSTQFAITIEATYSGSPYYHVNYLYFPIGASAPMQAFPPILQASNRGLSFFEWGSTTDSTGTRLPRLNFTLPYPAVVGSEWRDVRSDFTVTVAAKDTAILSYDSLNTYRCYRYDVEKPHAPGQRRRMSFYILPGSALLKIVDGDLTFFTTEWSVR
ncbi:MAG: hypothetical protein IPP94_02285 [Ignavibacteria bacterium]|nr:hypothetical protein [Ignavibacteria bacterium]